MNSVYFYLLLSAFVVNLMRMLPMTLIRGRIQNKFIRSFLFYVPYITLSVMTFPAILQATQIPIAGLFALIGAIILSWRDANLIQVALISCVIVFIIEFILL